MDQNPPISNRPVQQTNELDSVALEVGAAERKGLNYFQIGITVAYVLLFILGIFKWNSMAAKLIVAAIGLFSSVVLFIPFPIKHNYQLFKKYYQLLNRYAPSLEGLIKMKYFMFLIPFLLLLESTFMGDTESHTVSDVALFVISLMLPWLYFKMQPFMYKAIKKDINNRQGL